jgi:hypothetical protein
LFGLKAIIHRRFLFFVPKAITHRQLPVLCAKSNIFSPGGLCHPTPNFSYNVNADLRADNHGLHKI